MLRCPICHQALSPSGHHPYAPICSERCRRIALPRAGILNETTSAGQQGQAQFEQLTATHLYCSTCRRSMPTRERLLLTLPSGDLYGYVCAQCGTDVGTKTSTQP
jgi:endogenous inhibitor of DNA gyrase (YacG/DUF329 family)